MNRQRDLLRNVRTLPLALLLLSVACAKAVEPPRIVANVPPPHTTADAPTPRMAMSFDLKADPRTWEIQHLDANSQGILVEMVPKGDTVENWTEMVSQQIVFTPLPVGDFVKLFISGLQNVDADVKIRGEPGPDATVTVKYASTIADEISARKFFQGPDGVYMMAYHARLSSPETKSGYLLWKEIIARAYLLPNPNLDK